MSHRYFGKKSLSSEEIKEYMKNTFKPVLRKCYCCNDVIQIFYFVENWSYKQSNVHFRINGNNYQYDLFYCSWTCIQKSRIFEEPFKNRKHIQYKGGGISS